MQSTLTADQQWKSDLIRAIAHRKGFRAHDLDDAHQHVFLRIRKFKYDPEKANGASEETILAHFIELQLLQIQRGEVRRRKREHTIRRVCGPSQFQPATDDTHLDHERRFELRADVRVAIKALSPFEKIVCAALSKGMSRCEAAEQLNVSRYDIDKYIDRIRGKFEQFGLGSDEGSTSNAY